jgi:hypothetical protein
MGKRASHQTPLPGVYALPQRIADVAGTCPRCHLRRFWAALASCLDAVGGNVVNEAVLYGKKT